jgi:hypothetical protein
MPRITKPAKAATQIREIPPQTNEQYVKVRIKALEIPPVKDGIVIGRSAAIGAEAMLRTLKLMSTEHFVHIVVAKDEIVSDLIVREAVVRKLKEDRLRTFILNRIKPLMAANELLMLDMEIEVVIEESIGDGKPRKGPN